MKKSDLDATNVNIFESIQRDSLERNKYLPVFYNMLQNSGDIKIFSIDGEWGSGKTFFVKQLQLLINSYNSMGENREDSEAIKKTIHLENSDSSMLAVYYDAWKNDDDIDPIISILNEIQIQLDTELKDDFQECDFKDAIKDIIVDCISNPYLNGLNKFLTSIKTDDSIAKFEEYKEIEGKIKNAFSKLHEEKCNKLVIFVDELDRCNPIYAVKLLERVKHYLVNERIIFVFSINSLELQHTIKKYYGNAFNAYEYLDRFFDFRLKLPEVSEYKWNYFLGINGVSSSKVMNAIISYYNMSLRKALHYKMMCDIIMKNYNQFNEFLTFEIAPIVLGVFLSNINDYKSLMNGTNKDLFVKLICKADEFNYISSYLNIGPSLPKDNEETLYEDLYDAIFNLESSNSEKEVARTTFSRDTKLKLLEIVSFLSGIVDFKD